MNIKWYHGKSLMKNKEPFFDNDRKLLIKEYFSDDNF